METKAHSADPSPATDDMPLTPRQLEILGLAWIIHESSRHHGL